MRKFYYKYSSLDIDCLDSPSNPKLCNLLAPQIILNEPTRAARRLSVALVNHGVLDGAQTVDLDLDHVAVHQPLGNVHTQRHPCRRAGEDQIPGLERADVRQVRHNVICGRGRRVRRRTRKWGRGGLTTNLPGHTRGLTLQTKKITIKSHHMPMPKMRSVVDESWRRSPLTQHRRPRSCGSPAAPDITSDGPMGAKVS